ncbi:DUF1285 domain-containing protein [Endozoicomonas sp. SCSIO W0465]|uniref:DUF1285 domain-containing protein n=1 Tax=Endozoicomonas sp. SCSIO W0465 TaxID=2918516 RepID=UPI0020765849|nr:DUF1285 domain-containing protein [Endozoicomonas sp. SCSIO W0465]USE33736.1 DUF1285 domain-containing protein [Endozoicomonas sp. SCSIO W0465]
MSSQSNPDNIVSHLQFLKKKKELPPVHSWNPPFCGDIDMRISRDGRWHYNGSPIGRESMVRLFASVLRHDDDGHYYLVTPVEKVRIQVDDVPFIAVSAEVRDGSNGPEYLFSTNVGDEVVLDREHPLQMMKHKATGELVPYIRVRDRLNALVNRNVFYQLIEEAREVDAGGGIELKISSQGRDYSLGFVEGG